MVDLSSPSLMTSLKVLGFGDLTFRPKLSNSGCFKWSFLRLSNYAGSDFSASFGDYGGKFFWDRLDLEPFETLVSVDSEMDDVKEEVSSLEFSSKTFYAFNESFCSTVVLCWLVIAISMNKSEFLSATFVSFFCMFDKNLTLSESIITENDRYLLIFGISIASSLCFTAEDCISFGFDKFLFSGFGCFEFLISRLELNCVIVFFKSSKSARSLALRRSLFSILDIKIKWLRFKDLGGALYELAYPTDCFLRKPFSAEMPSS